MGKVIFAIAWLLLEGMGLPLLSEGAFGPLGAAVYSGSITLPVAYLLAWTATCIGNTIGFFIFFNYGPALLEWMGKRWPAFQKKRMEIEPKVRLQLYLAMTVARFIGFGTFQVVLWLSGVFRARWTVFLPFLFVLNLLWTGFWLFGSHWLVGIVLPHLEGRSWWQLTLIALGAVALYLAGHRVFGWVQTTLKARRRSH